MSALPAPPQHLRNYGPEEPSLVTTLDEAIERLQQRNADCRDWQREYKQLEITQGELVREVMQLESKAMEYEVKEIMRRYDKRRFDLQIHSLRWWRTGLGSLCCFQAAALIWFAWRCL